jgi:acetolactate synthase-1/2/3 large subunit
MTNRRSFLKRLASVGAASGLGVASNPANAEASTPTGQKLSATPPSSREETMEGELPEGYSETEGQHYFVQHAGSDFMVDVVKSLGIDCLASNPGSSFRGLQIDG